MTSVRDNGLVEFRFYRPNVKHVAIAGDFNQWNQQDLTMRPVDEGWWVAAASLAPGEYRFRYIADGRWFTDYAAQGVEMSKQGWNSLLMVPEPTTAAQAMKVAA